MSNPTAVLISDVHYSVPTLQLADAAMTQAINKANELEVPLIVAGDLHDTKANLRGECVNEMINTVKTKPVFMPYIMIGNHDKINEKSQEHSLNFLAPYANIINSCTYIEFLNLIMIPYQHDTNDMLQLLSLLSPKESILIVHQGVQNTNSGHYIQDKSALSREAFSDFRTISGHYHSRQTIKCGRPRKNAVGLFDYIGNPYSLNFGEANDPPKGFQILMDDGSLEFVPTNLRQHRIYEFDLEDIPATGIGRLNCRQDDLVWVKIKGNREALATITKSWVSKDIGLDTFKLDLIPNDTQTSTDTRLNLTQGPLLDSLIDSLSNTTDERKQRLKGLWRDLA